MHWIKFLHIVALVCWCAALLYLPALLHQRARAASANPAGGVLDVRVLPRLLYIALATPAALVAIMSGSVLFLVQGLTGGWLVLKLLAVCGMVLSHAGCGWLVMRLEEGEARKVATGALLCGGLAGICMFVVVVLVLAKPVS
ncbi:CopD family protein [Halomonas urumqiensis]|uniref:Protoporphyrinogen IX oxidase n=1 Tax=Halomonas urumqiensis TaxID=1684789 RepID=A0A2N7UFK0_9GAMM|nr:CopD family protein [Halomonas urumqiensis]PMR79226.1 hypothetical protein C1H70_13085 [Halomonas urumqiensis]PTB03900.1 hypothetical protein C6V82_05370 [Halomonas urumqiensis]GHE19858.1 hypothetical protein GCM10017767_03790 [Halomonas urumqiensis]